MTSAVAGLGVAEPVCVLSPHLDDAVFGCGELLAARPGSVVITIFAGAPATYETVTEWDALSGFGTGEDVVAARSKGELLALAAGRAAGDDEPVILLQGFDETRWERPDLPTLEELDAVTGKPLVIRRIDGHVALANSAALTLGGIGLAQTAR